MLANELPQLLQVAGGVVEAVDMVQAQAADQPLIQQFFDVLVIMIKHRPILHVEADQAVDGKKAAKVDLLLGFLPVAEAVDLLFGDLPEQFPVGIYLFEASLQVAPAFGVFQQGGQLQLQFVQAFGIGSGIFQPVDLFDLL
ncbi:hypothetical protein ADICEAN_03987 [Cesiribacter andamanensis AMV16]|uniref:Uncharacterized protein n=1 Tax=Cesiribacter andamanensis AMV16 TaxID=1279009 RepID=M7N0Q0_9BACT|nr:hypothetical protein ADICEAN_03987 [Cesiribacter andamanensis AMV16]